MCKRGAYKNVRVKICGDLPHTETPYWKNVKIDACISDIVKALQDAGINMLSSCCGHGEMGKIELEDGRIIYILPNWKNVNANGKRGET